ncbi:MAG: hypothetical protein ACI8Y4_002973 [Candidatus Poriferisodalaceae bacterium]
MIFGLLAPFDLPVALVLLEIFAPYVGRSIDRAVGCRGAGPRSGSQSGGESVLAVITIAPKLIHDLDELLSETSARGLDTSRILRGRQIEARSSERHAPLVKIKVEHQASRASVEMALSEDILVLDDLVGFVV